MIVTLTVDGEPPKRWEWTAQDVRQREAEQIEVKAGVLFDKFHEQVLMGGARARRVLVWHLLRQDHPQLKLDDVDFRGRELKIEPDTAELRTWRDSLLSRKGNQLTDEQREQAAAWIDAELAALAEKAERDGEVAAEGKVPSGPSESATSA